EIRPIIPPRFQHILIRFLHASSWSTPRIFSTVERRLQSWPGKEHCTLHRNWKNLQKLSERRSSRPSWVKHPYPPIAPIQEAESGCGVQNPPRTPSKDATRC